MLENVKERPRKDFKITIIFSHPYILPKCHFGIRRYFDVTNIYFKETVYRLPSVCNVVYPHACAEAYIASRNHRSNKLKTHITDRKRF